MIYEETREVELEIKRNETIGTQKNYTYTVLQSIGNT